MQHEEEDVSVSGVWVGVKTASPRYRAQVPGLMNRNTTILVPRVCTVPNIHVNAWHTNMVKSRERSPLSLCNISVRDRLLEWHLKSL